MSALRTDRSIWIPLLLAFVLRLAMYPMSGIENPRTFEYGDIAEQLAAGNGYTTTQWLASKGYVVPSAFMPPGQVLIISSFYALFGIKSQIAHHFLFLLNALLGTGAVLLIGKIARQFVNDRRVHSIVLYSAALFIPFISASATWGVASSVLFLNSLLIFTAMRLSQAVRDSQQVSKPALLFGLTAGILMLFRGEAPLTVLFIGIALLILHRTRFSVMFRGLLIAAVVSIALYGPWIIFNYVRFDTLVLGSTNGGYNLWRGNNPIASGGGWTAEGALIYPTYEQDLATLKHLEGYPRDQWEIAMNKRYQAMAVSWIKENPGTAAVLMLKKAFLIWVVDWYRPGDAGKNHYIYLACQLLAVILGIVGLFGLSRWSIKSHVKEWLFIAGAASLATTLVTMAFFSLPRYQIFLVGIYFPLVGIGVTEVLFRVFPRYFQHTEDTHRATTGLLKGSS